MFNTQSTFTKERRRQGFDDFLKVLVTLMPIPEVTEFLELDRFFFQDQKRFSNGGNQPRIVNTGTTASNTNTVPIASAVLVEPTKTQVTSPASSQSTSKVNTAVKQLPVNNLSSGSSGSVIEAKQSSTLSTFVFKVLPSSFAIVASLYFALYGMKVIDISKSTKGIFDCFVGYLMNN
jgi:hypothetical protein